MTLAAPATAIASVDAPAPDPQMPSRALPDGGKRLGLLVEPLDVFFCRDGRPFGESTVALGGLPHPQVIAGALRTHVFRRLNVLPRGDGAEKWLRGLEHDGHGWARGLRSRGPWLCRAEGGHVTDVFVPTPADVVYGKKAPTELLRLKPRREPPPGWGRSGPQQGLLPLWHGGDDDVKPAGEYLGREALRTYLAGGVPAAVTRADVLFDFEHRTGIAIDPDRLTAAESQIYSIRLVRLRGNVALYAELDLLSGGPSVLADVFPSQGWIIRLGGEGKLARVRPMEPWNWPPGSGLPQGQRDVLLLTAPAAFDLPYWRPNFDKWGYALKAAAVPSYASISGWDLAQRRPKPTRHFVSAGSVYFLEDATPGVPGRVGENLVERRDALLGYGTCLKGTWDYG